MNKIIIFLIILSLSSCVKNYKSKFDPYNPNKIKNSEIVKEIGSRKEEIKKLKIKIETLKNYNSRFERNLFLLKSSNRDVDYFNSQIERNRKIIKKFNLIIKKNNQEIRILERIRKNGKN